MATNWHKARIRIMTKRSSAIKQSAPKIEKISSRSSLRIDASKFFTEPDAKQEYSDSYM